MEMLSALKVISSLRQEAIVSAIKELNLPKGSKGLDAACGIGNVSQLLAKEVGKNGNITGIDIDSDILKYAKEEVKKNNMQKRITFCKEDINKLSFSDNSFDWVVSIDTIWPGPKEFDLPCEDPIPIMKELKRVVKSNGTIAILFWSSQKILNGYPVLEAKLNTLSSALIPYNENTLPSLHILKAKNWMQEVSLKDIKVKTFVSDFSSPLSQLDKEGLLMTFDMLYNKNLKEEIDSESWDKYKKITNPKSKNFILDNKDYYGFITYTLFYGRVNK